MNILMLFDQHYSALLSPIVKLLLCCLLLFLEPNDESGANVDASVSFLRLHAVIIIIYFLVCSTVQKMWRDNRKQFNDIAQSLVRKSLGL